MGIAVHGINKSFGRFALNNVDLKFPDGELTALLGPSGCGKTTLLRIVAGLDTPDSGWVEFDGQDYTKVDVRERNVGFVFQHYALFRHMTVFDNVAFGLQVKARAQRLPKAEIHDRVKHLLERVQLSALAKRYPAELSGGQRQRVALARALATEPKVLLLDEPFGALDAKVRKELRTWMRELHDEMHVTTLFVTHDQDEALEVADRVVIMNGGRVEQEGAPGQVYDQPATPFVASFLGDFNLFHGFARNRRVQVQGVDMHTAHWSGADHGDALVYARPQQLSINSEGRGLPAELLRVLEVGAHARIELRIGQQSKVISAIVPRAEFALLEAVAGQKVWVEPRSTHVFVDANSSAVG